MAEIGADIFRDVLDHCSDGVCLVDPAGWQILFANRRFRDCTSTTADRHDSLFACLPELAARRQELEQVTQGQAVDATFPIGPACEVHARRVGELLAIYLLPTANAAAKRIDPLTGLADRTFFMERLAMLLRGERASDNSCAVLFIDVDGFKHVNDDHGHLVGDRVLGEVARRLAGSLRTGDTIARFGGDEFVVLLESIRGPEEIEPVAERIRAAFDSPIVHADGEVKLAVSVGRAIAGAEHHSAEALINAADRAMYAAKRTAT